MLIAKPNIHAAGSVPCGRFSVFDIFNKNENIGRTSLYVGDQRGLITLRGQTYTVEPVIEKITGSRSQVILKFFQDYSLRFVLLSDDLKSMATAEIQGDVYLSHGGQSYILVREGFIYIT